MSPREERRLIPIRRRLPWPTTVASLPWLLMLLHSARLESSLGLHAVDRAVDRAVADPLPPVLGRLPPRALRGVFGASRPGVPGRGGAPPKPAPSDATSASCNPRREAIEARESNAQEGGAEGSASVFSCTSSHSPPQSRRAFGGPAAQTASAPQRRPRRSG